MRKGGGLATWICYPVTLLECALMACSVIASWWWWRIVYCRWWYPDSARHPPVHLVKPKIDVAAALGAMQTIERLARDSGAGVFWISGTLLGLERLGHPLPHDKDMDVGIDVHDPHCADFIRALAASDSIIDLAPQFVSWKVRTQNPDLHCIPRGLMRYTCAVRVEGVAGQPPVKLDVFLHFPYRGGVVHGTRNSLWWNTVPGVAQKAYGGRSFSVPADAHLYLAENYGDYRQEVKEFENSIDCPNALDIFSWKSWAYLWTRQRAMLRLGRVDRARRVNARLMSTVLKGLLPRTHRPAIHLGS